MAVAQNPILSGFFPDPSICRVGEDYYLVNSTFSYVPGVPVFHSRDLANWAWIGHVLTRPEQLPLEGAEMSWGIYAPTLRYHDGVFYMITTNIGGGGNFYVTAADPGGEWSDPVWLPDAEGIDPSLFFDGDDCWYVGQRQRPGSDRYGDCEIWVQRLDLEAGKLTGEKFSLWDGSMKNAVWAEGPHLYRQGEYYYLLIAESGTGFEHSLSVARSKALLGPYESCGRNPVFTHRNLGKGYPVQNTGHADLVNTPDGAWYAVMLATRPLDGCAELGRETFLAEVVWEDGWPVINAGEGKLRERQETALSEVPVPLRAMDSWGSLLRRDAVFFRYPEQDLYTIGGDGVLTLRMQANALPSPESASYIGVRITARSFSLRVGVDCVVKQEQEAGLLYLYNAKNHLRLTVHALAGGGQEVRAILMEDGIERIVGAAGLSAGVHTLFMEGNAQRIDLFADELAVASQVSVRELCSERAGGFVGCTAGIYAAAHGGERGEARFSPLEARFDRTL